MRINIQRNTSNFDAEGGRSAHEADTPSPPNQFIQSNSLSTEIHFLVKAHIYLAVVREKPQ